MYFDTLCVSFSFVFFNLLFCSCNLCEKRCIYNTNECDGDFRGRRCPAAGGQIFGQAVATAVKVAERRGRLVGSLPSTRSRPSVRYLSVSRRAAAVFDRRRRSRRRCRHLQAKRYRRRRRYCGRINGTGRAGSIVGAVIMLITSCLLRSHTSHSKPIQQSCAGARPQLETVAEERRKYWRSQKTLQAGMGNWVGPSRPWRSGGGTLGENFGQNPAFQYVLGKRMRSSTLD